MMLSYQQSLINSHSSGYLSIVVGPMFSGKSLHLISTCEKLSDIGFRSLIIIPELETRNSDNVFSHSSGYRGVSKKVDVMKTSSLLDVDVQLYDVIAVDECQFFDQNLRGAIETWLILKKRIYLASLDGDFKQKIFGSITEMLPIADDFVKIKSKCSKCCELAKHIGSHIYNDAIFTHRKDLTTINIIAVGGTEMYEPLCRYHMAEVSIG